MPTMRSTSTRKKEANDQCYSFKSCLNCRDLHYHGKSCEWCQTTSNDGLCFPRKNDEDLCNKFNENRQTAIRLKQLERQLEKKTTLNPQRRLKRLISRMDFRLIYCRQLITIDEKNKRLTTVEKTANENQHVTLIIVLIGIAFFLLVGAIFTCICLLHIRQGRKYAIQKEKLRILYQQFNDQNGCATITVQQNNGILNDKVDHVAYDDNKYELNKEFVKTVELLGEGEFGKIFRGTYIESKGETLQVAIKVPRNGRDIDHQKALLTELKIMIAIEQHVNIVKLIGAVTKKMIHGELYIVTEFCSNGNLRAYLRKKRSKFIDEICELQPERTVYQAERNRNWASEMKRARLASHFLTTCDLLSFACQTANGMIYLGQKTLAIQLIHRDLAARNIFLTENLVVKIADFGLARQYQAYHVRRSKGTPLPLKWMAPESIDDLDFSVKSDVWSFGVVLWEIFALGNEPYPGRAPDAGFASALKRGVRMEAPNYTPAEIGQLMQKCWQYRPSNRPTFDSSRATISEQLQRCSQPSNDERRTNVDPSQSVDNPAYFTSLHCSETSGSECSPIALSPYVKRNSFSFAAPSPSASNRREIVGSDLVAKNAQTIADSSQRQDDKEETSTAKIVLSLEDACMFHRIVTTEDEECSYV